MSAPTAPDIDPDELSPDEVEAPPPGPDPDVAGARELLSWARANRFAMQSLRVGKVEIVGLVDLAPRQPLPGMGSARVPDEPAGSPYDEVGGDLPAYTDWINKRRGESP